MGSKDTFGLGLLALLIAGLSLLTGLVVLIVGLSASKRNLTATGAILLVFGALSGLASFALCTSSI